MALTEEELEAIADRVAKKMRKSEKDSDESQKPTVGKKKLSPTEASFLTGMIQTKPKGKALDA